LAIFLAVALFVCHGVLWGLHLCPDSQLTAAHQSHGHHLLAGNGVMDHEEPVCHLVGGADYFTVLLATFLGLALRLLLKGIWPYKGTAPFTSGRHLHTFVMHPPRGPTAPVLQVFRL
jgi:hypothetical protein